VQLGQELELAVSETGETVAMKVSHIAAVLDPASVTFEVCAEVDNRDGDLRAGMNGSLSLSSVGAR
jgi:multidrug efflux pump subunit AcrA (membrane-fusion protein)